MASFTVRGVDTALWTRLRERAEAEGRTPTAVLESCIKSWLHSTSLSDVTVRWAFRAAEKGWNLDKTLEEFRRLTNGQS